jgi:hypothetical protein
MQPFDPFKERLVRYRMVPVVPSSGYAVDSRPNLRLAKTVAKLRLIVASCAALVMTIVFVGAFASH